MSLVAHHHAPALRQNYSLSTSERNKLLFEWNQTANNYPRDSCIHQLFEEQVERTPEALALIDGGNRLTYSELNGRANQLAHHLRSLGVGADSLVGVCIERSWRMVVGILAVLKAGGAYVPLDPKYPKARLAFMLEDAKVPVLLTTQSSSMIVPSPGTHVVCLDSQWAEIGDLSRENPIRQTTASDLADVIYTSGSTGLPKGVALEHRGAVALIFWAREVYTDQDLAGVLASTSICFDLSVFEMFVPLSWGGKVILAENALALPNLAARNEVTLLNTVPSAIRELLRIKGVSASVRVVNLAGEPLPTDVVNQIHAQTSVQKVYDLYGPTETTTYSTFALRSPHQPPTIGRPLSNETVYLLDEFQQLVPIGSIGELYLGGDGLARGYLNHPELTREKFVPHPFKPGHRLYKTGDLARWRLDGNLEYLGRTDHQVKIRGYRVELGEIEMVLNRVHGVCESVVVARNGASGQMELVAYVVQKNDSALKSLLLRNALKKDLPDYMVPSVVVFLDKFPLTPSGKLDRNALPPPVAGDYSEDFAYTPPRTEMEREFATIWEEIFQRNPIGIHDGFFNLGGDSLLAVRLIECINERFSAAFDPTVLLVAPTIAALVQRLPSKDSAFDECRLIQIIDGKSESNICFLNPPLDLFWLVSKVPIPFPLFATNISFPKQGLQAAIRGDISRFPTVAEIAAPHVELIRKRSFAGPVVLAGYSYGGVLAFEAAHQLRQHGVIVDLVCLFDTNIPWRGWASIVPTISFHLRQVCASRGAYLWSKAADRFRRIRKRPLQTDSPIYRPGETEQPLSSQAEWLLVDQVWKHALRSYRPPPLPARGLLFRAQQSLYTEGNDLDGRLGWSNLFLKGLEVNETPGDHGSIWQEPHVWHLTSTWQQALHQLQNQRGLSRHSNLSFR